MENAPRVNTPAWYYPALAVGFGAYLLAVTFGGSPLRVIATAALLFGVLALAKAAGAKVTGQANVRSLTIVGVVGAAVVASLILHDAAGLAWLPYVLAALVAVTVLVLGPRVDAAAQ